jgi:hypothetical protein
MNALRALMIMVFLAPVLTGCNQPELTKTGKILANGLQKQNSMTKGEAEELVGLVGKAKNQAIILTILDIALPSTKGDPEWQSGELYGIAGIHGKYSNLKSNKCNVSSPEDFFSVEKSICLLDEVFQNMHNNIEAGRITEEQKESVKKWGESYVMFQTYYGGNWIAFNSANQTYAAIKNVSALVKK